VSPKDRSKKKAESGGTGRLRSALNQWAIYTIIALSVACLVGVLVPQIHVQISPAELQALVARRPALTWLDAFGFFNVFGAWWFILLVTLLVVNLVVCSSLGLKRLTDLRRRQNAAAGRALLDGMKTFRTVEDAGADAERIARAWVSRFGAVTDRSDKASGTTLFAERGFSSRLGVYAIHLSVLLIVAGAAIGGALGIHGNMNIPEGGTEAHIDLERDDAGEQIHLPFAIRCDWFEMELYPGTRRPKDYKSGLTVLEGDRVVLTKTIEVNDPLDYGGYRFFQASYGQYGGKNELGVVERDTGREFELVAVDDQWAEVPGSPDTVTVIDFAENHQNAGPALRLRVRHEGGKTEEAWIFQRAPEFDRGRDGTHVFTFRTRTPAYYTGLSVQRDPGVPVVWAGFLLMFLGLVMAYVYHHHRAAALVTGGKVILAASTSRLPDALEHKAERILKGIDHDHPTKGA
jgi:cytochrome c biogenesis protein